MGPEATVWHPQNRRLLWAVLGAQVILVALPFFKHEALPVIVVLMIVSAAALFGSPSRAMLFLCFSAAVVPSWFFHDYLQLPLGFRFYEGLFGLLFLQAGLLWLMDGRLIMPHRTRLDRPVLVFLALLVFSIGLGFYHGQSTSQMARDVRSPFYYALFFTATGFFDLKKRGFFLGVVVGSAALVALEYFWELLQEVDLRIAGDFFRVARIEGLMFPMGILAVGSILLFDPEGHRRKLALLALVPISAALVLTVGRGMWIGTFSGLICLGVVGVLDPKGRGQRFRRLSLLAMLLTVTAGAGFLFHAWTPIGLGRVASLRVGRVVDRRQDVTIAGRFVSYAAAIREIRKRPWLGGGHGATVRYLMVHTAERPSIMITGAVDNLYLTIWMRMGAVGLLSFLWIFWVAFRLAFSLFRRSEHAQTRLFCAAFMGIYSGLLVYSLADSTLFGNRLIFFHAMFLGILGRLDAEEQV